jgi:hypothetical protein
MAAAVPDFPGRFKMVPGDMPAPTDIGSDWANREYVIKKVPMQTRVLRSLKFSAMPPLFLV